ncbi:MAG: Fic family protein [Solirubrobacteraceae bacterium]
MARARQAGAARGAPARKGYRGRFERQSWPADFSSGCKGRAASYQAFVPDPILDLAVSLDGPSATLVSDAEGQIRALNHDPPGLVSLDAFARQLLRSEALASSAIEGLALSHKRLARAVVVPQYDRRAREVLNNIRAMEDAVALGAVPGPLKVADLLDVHATLAAGTRLAPWAGRLRDEPGWVDGTTPADARYVPPPHQYVPELTEDLVAFVNERDDLPTVTQAAIAHAQFETIHPFADGNGRTGRCIIHIILIRRGLAPRYVPPVSIVLAARRDRYLDGLGVYERGGIASWCDFFVTAARDSATTAAAFASEVAAVQDAWRGEVTARRDAAVWPLIDALPAYPVIDARTAEAVTGKSFQAANTALGVLEGAGVLVRHDNRKRGRTWEAPALLDLLRGFEVELRTDGEDDDDR